MTFEGSIVLSLLLVACGGGSAVRHSMPPSRLANESVKTSPRIVCIEELPYAPERGCSTPLWGTPVSLEHRNQMGSGFRLVGAAFALDGELVFDTNDEDLLARESFPVFTTNVSSGEHELSVLLVYRGHGYGVFAYLSGYRFQSKESHVFRVESRGVRLRSIGFEQSDVPLEKRPAMRIQSW